MDLCKKFGLDVDKAIDQLLEHKMSQSNQVSYENSLLNC